LTSNKKITSCIFSQEVIFYLFPALIIITALISSFRSREVWSVANPLLSFEPFDTLTEEWLESLRKHLTVCNYTKGEYLFNQGQPSLGKLFLIESGLVEIIVRGENGMRNVAGLRHPGQFLGETVILSDGRYPAAAKAIKDLTCYLLDKEPFEKLLQSNQEFAGFFSHILAGRLHELYEEMVHEQSPETFGLGLDPFQKRVCDIMSTPVITCPAVTPVNDIARILGVQKISSVVVTSSTGKLLGLVSERDLITKVLALDCNPKVVFAEDIMDKNPPTLPPDAFFYQALLNMIKSQGKYVLIIEQGQPIGVVTIGDLTKARTASTLSMVSKIESARSGNELAEIAPMIPTVLASMLNDKAPVKEISIVISELYDRLTRRLLTLGENSLAKNGWGLPPVDYCWLALGSSGRKEQTLASDQDNAIIYADPPQVQDLQVRSYFSALASYVVDGLAQCGFAKCSENLMASNPLWCQPLSKWKSDLQRWAHSPKHGQTRQFTLFLDFRSIYGHTHLADGLRDYCLRMFRNSPSILRQMTKEDLRETAPMQQFSTAAIDLSRSACVHIVDCIRIFTLHEGLRENSTWDRLNKLVEVGAFPADEAEYLEASYQSLMLLRLRENLRKLGTGQSPDNCISPETLSKRQRSVLRESFMAIERLQSFTRRNFNLDIQS
jgi:CBS domain-containing protein